ncbi:hypothetical protein [Haloechinothrix halophila]|uniref:Uncharacterized protein n=1 Tax=Haloechinothrix halophila YIM 93223 TaxID=592678 RepID=W9DS51_9PSEU|nr:hypothetical protein [Haloechinothrix halophila]ETA66512.1 hypothetical protein AmyhaDRAFT_0271 [Haloechinothrix halophila YIM 93223]
MTTGPYGPNDPDEDGPSPRDDDYYPVDEAERAAMGLPPLSSDRRERADPPQLVRISVLLWLLAAGVMVAGFVLMLANQRAITEELLDAYQTAQRAGESIANRGISDSEVAAGVPGLLWLLLVGSLMIAGLIGLFAYRVREGTRSARTALLLLAALLLVFVVGMPSAFVNPLHVIALGLAVIAAVLLFLPNVSGYFPPLPKVRRRWQDYS